MPALFALVISTSVRSSLPPSTGFPASFLNVANAPLNPPDNVLPIASSRRTAPSSSDARGYTASSGLTTWKYS